MGRRCGGDVRARLRKRLHDKSLALQEEAWSSACLLLPDIFSVHRKIEAKKRAQAKKECPKLIKACKVKNGRQCASRCKAVWYMRYQYQASCKAYSCK